MEWSNAVCGAELGVFDYVSQDKARTAEEVAAEIDMEPALLDGCCGRLHHWVF